jgi:hypothetical protein
VPDLLRDARDLPAFLLSSFMGDQQLARDAAVAGLGERDAARSALGRLVLKRALLLVLLLDSVASQPKLPPGAPLLFRVDSPVKSSAQVRGQPIPQIGACDVVVQMLGGL